MTPKNGIEVYPVRLPKDMIEKFPAAKIRTGKKIQDFIRDSIRDGLKRVNL